MALERILLEEVEHLPVVEHGAHVGMCTRTDILRARQHQLELERRQAGWRPTKPWRPPASWRTRRGSSGAGIGDTGSDTERSGST